MKVSSVVGKALLEKLVAAQPGKPISLPSPFPAIDCQSAQGFLTRKETDYFILELFWLGAKFGEVSAQVCGEHLVIETL